MKSLEAQRLEGSSKKKMSVRAGIAFLLMVVFFIVATVLPAAAGRCDPGKDDNKPGCFDPGTGAPIIPLKKMDIFEVHWTDDGFVVVGEHFLQDGTTITAGLGSDEGEGMGGIPLVIAEGGIASTTVDLLAPDPPLEHGTYILTIIKKSDISGRKIKADIAITIAHDEIKHVKFGGEIVDDLGDLAPELLPAGEGLELVGECPVPGKVIGLSCGKTIASHDPSAIPLITFPLTLTDAKLNHMTQGGKCTWEYNDGIVDEKVFVLSRELWLLCVEPSLAVEFVDPPATP